MYFLEWICLIFDQNVTEDCSQGSIFNSDNGSAPNRRYAIIWNDDVLSCQRIYASLGLNELTAWYRCRNIQEEPDQYHCCWCSGSLHRQIISSHVIDGVKEVDHCLLWGRFRQTAAEIMAWVNNHISRFYIDVITYLCPNLNTGWDNFC